MPKLKKLHFRLSKLRMLKELLTILPVRSNVLCILLLGNNYFLKQPPSVIINLKEGHLKLSSLRKAKSFSSNNSNLKTTMTRDLGSTV